MASRQVECALLAKMLSSRAICGRVFDRLNPSDFAFREHRALYQSIADVYLLSENGAAPDDLLVQQHFAKHLDGETRVDPIRAIATVRSGAFAIADSYVDAYVTEIHRAAERRDLRKLTLEIDRRIEEGEDIPSIKAAFDHDITRLSRGFDADAWGPSHDLAELTQTELPPIVSILGTGTLIDGGLHLFTAAPGYGKSWLMVMLQVSVALGHDWLNIETTPTRVGYLAMELPPQEYQTRLRACIDALDMPRDHALASLEGHWYLSSQDTHGSIDLRNPKDVAALTSRVQDTSTGLLILDPASRIHSYDENAANEMALFIGTLDRLRIETGCAILLVHHEPKSTKDLDDVYAGRGSGRFASDPTSILRLKKHPKTEQLMLVSAKQNFGTPFDAIGLDYEKGCPYHSTDLVHTTSTIARDTLTSELVDVLMDLGTATTRQLMDATGSARGIRTYQRLLGEIPQVKSLGGSGQHRLWGFKGADDADTEPDA